MDWTCRVIPEYIYGDDTDLAGILISSLTESALRLLQLPTPFPDRA